MAIPVIIYGRSGSGKSTSLGGLNDAIIFNICGKKLPYKNNPTQVVVSKTKKTGEALNYSDIMEYILGAVKKGYKKIVIDDSWQLIGRDYMERSTTASGNAVFDSYNKLAKHCYDLYQFIINGVPNSDDVVVYLVSIEDINDMGYTQPYRIGKLLENKVPLEAYCSIVLRAFKDNGNYFFRTNTDGYDVCKSPKGMFATDRIPNDLNDVDNAIRTYWDLFPKEEEKTNTEEKGE